MSNRRQMSNGMGGMPPPFFGRSVGGGDMGDSSPFPQAKHMPFQTGYSTVSPWQQSGGGSGAAGSLLGSISSPQLALALSLLQQQQQHLQQRPPLPQQQPSRASGPPSLLSLNVPPTVAAAFPPHRPRISPFRSGGNSANFTRRNDSYDKGRDSWRVVDPYPRRDHRDANSSSSGQRHESSSRRRASQRRRSSRSPVRSRSSRRSRSRSRRRDDKKETTTTKSSTTADTSNVIKENDDDGGDGDVATVEVVEVTEQKPETETDDSAAADKEKASAEEQKKAADKKENNDKNKEKEKERQRDRERSERRTAKAAAIARYDGVSAKFLHCFVCNKDMWDGESFVKHVKGCAHLQIVNTLEGSFHVTVNILRAHLQLCEENKVIELTRANYLLSMHRHQPAYSEDERNYCNMCKLRFIGQIGSHRKSEGHLRLKQFLHPACKICNKEFPSRIDWVHHRLTYEHLQQLQKSLEKRVGGEDGATIEKTSEGDDKTDVVDENNDREKVKKEELETAAILLEEGALNLNVDDLLDEVTDHEDEHPIIEMDEEDLQSCQNRMPAFRRNRPVATKCLVAFSGYMCTLCKRSFDSDTLAQAHLRSEAHYYAFIGAIKERYQKQQEAKKAAMEEERRKRRRQEEEKMAKDEAEQRKKRKEEPEKIDDKNDAVKMEVNVKKDETVTNQKDIYDPEEAYNVEEEIDDVHEAALLQEENEGEDDEAVEFTEVVLNDQVKEEIIVKNGEEHSCDSVPSEITGNKLMQPIVKVVNSNISDADTPPTPTPRRRMVRNGAGPKCSKIAREKNAAVIQQIVQQNTATNMGRMTPYRIPKLSNPTNVTTENVKKNV